MNATLRKRCVFDGPFPVAAEVPAPPSDNDEEDDWWSCDVAGPGCLKPTKEAPELPLPYSIWRYEAACLSCEWVACSVCGARFGADVLVEERFE